MHVKHVINSENSLNLQNRFFTLSLSVSLIQPYSTNTHTMYFFSLNQKPCSSTYELSSTTVSLTVSVCMWLFVFICVNFLFKFRFSFWLILFDFVFVEVLYTNLRVACTFSNLSLSLALSLLHSLFI